MIINFDEAVYTARITVTYPSGTCTVTHESGVNYSHSGGGKHTFTVHRRGDWDILALDGAHDASASVTLIDRGQIVTKTLSYELVLFDSSVTSGWGTVLWADVYSSGGIEAGKLFVKDASSFVSGALVYKTEPVNTSGYTKAKITVDSIENNNSRAWLVLQNTPNIGRATEATNERSVVLTGAGEFEITSLPEGSYYVGIVVGQNEVRASRVWLE